MTPDMQRPYREPDITVNGAKLTHAQAMTMRVALSHFCAELSESDFCEALGEVGPLYRQRASEVLRLILAEPATT